MGTSGGRHSGSYERSAAIVTRWKLLTPMGAGSLRQIGQADIRCMLLDELRDVLLLATDSGQIVKMGVSH